MSVIRTGFREAVVYAEQQELVSYNGLYKIIHQMITQPLAGQSTDHIPDIYVQYIRISEPNNEVPNKK